jgi:hypothetical protein
MSVTESRHHEVFHEGGNTVDSLDYHHIRFHLDSFLPGLVIGLIFLFFDSFVDLIVCSCRFQDLNEIFSQMVHPGSHYIDLISPKNTCIFTLTMKKSEFFFLQLESHQ